MVVKQQWKYYFAWNVAEIQIGYILLENIVLSVNQQLNQQF